MTPEQLAANRRRLKRRGVAMLALFVGGWLIACLLGALTAYQDSMFSTCMDESHGRSAILICNFRMLAGGPREYAILAMQWLLFLGPPVLLIAIGSRGARKRAKRRIKNRARGIAGKAALNSQHIHPE